VFHCVHSNTLYVKNRRNKSEEKKTKLLQWKTYALKKNKKKKNCCRKTKNEKKNARKKTKKKTEKKNEKKCPKKKKTLATVNFLRVLVYYLMIELFKEKDYFEDIGD
jgi:hypothetical protein